MSVPKVSVVMSVYNGQRYLRRAIESILAQEFRDFEFIIVNDGSNDGSRAILAEYESRDPRIRVIDQENRGLTKSLIRGCAEARGEYIARQDADDWSHPRRLASCVELLDQQPECVIASSWSKCVDAEGDLVDAIERPADSRAATLALLHERIGPPGHGSVTFRRLAYEKVGGYRECFYFGQDGDLWLRLASIGGVVYAQEYLYTYLVTPSSISGAHSPAQFEFAELGHRCQAARMRGESELPFLEQAQRLRAQVLEARSKGSDGPSVRLGNAAANYRIGTCLSRRGNPRAKEYFWTAIRLNPLHWRSWCRLGAELLRPGRAKTSVQGIGGQGGE
jgi:cellulose synthase/poly-beta-1,6-N-acetylglucosamine synthase-like glycosyltransferase